MTVQQLLEAHIRNVQEELASQREVLRIVQQQLLMQPVEAGQGWGLRPSY